MTDIEIAIEYFKRVCDNTMISAGVIDSIQDPLLCETRKKNIQIAITALEKQIPKSPIVFTEIDQLACQSCGKLIRIRSSRPWQIKSYPKYCDNCGQALDWREVLYKEPKIKGD